jgi:hypothetical protein
MLKLKATLGLDPSFALLLIIECTVVLGTASWRLLE